MGSIRAMTLPRVLMLVVSLLIVKVTVEVVCGYVNYFPANFESEFLRGREAYFASRYQWAFYPHIASGPVSLLMGLVLISDRFRMRFPRWHRWLGRIQVANVLLLVTPSGLIMAWDAAAGSSAVVAFVMLAVVTAVCTAFGWRTAVQRRFAAHRVWMLRSYVLLCSAVVLRVVAGLATVLEVQSVWFDPIASWACWLGPLLIFEVSIRSGRSSWFSHRQHQVVEGQKVLSG